jgi:hypothetical protein
MYIILPKLHFQISVLALEKMEYPIFNIHVEPYIVGKLGYISQLLMRFYFNLKWSGRLFC